MLNQIFKISLILMLISIGCKKEENFSVINSNISPKQNLNDTVVKQLKNKDFSLKIVSLLLNDTLDVDDYKRNSYSNPIILNQNLSFFEGKSLLNQHKLPINNVKVKTITKALVNIIDTPIYKMCLVKNSNKEFL